MKAAQTITELIGNTPLLRLREISEDSGASVYGKVEYFNPLSSVKDRIAFAMIERAEQEGKLAPGGLIVEPTSGNTGIGLAYVAAAKGYRLILTMPESMSVERRKILKVLGAEVVLTAANQGMKGAVSEAEAIVAQHPGSFMPHQFRNGANPDIHRKTTAIEIWDATEGQIDIFIAGIGTGGTITGCGSVLKEKNPDIKIIAIEPDESAVLSGEKPGPHRIQGIGAGFVPEVLDSGLIDEIIRIRSEDAAEMTRHLAKNEGLLVGISSGAAALAAKRIAEREDNTGKTIVTLLPDSGERYLSTWIFES